MTRDAPCLHLRSALGHRRLVRPPSYQGHPASTSGLLLQRAPIFLTFCRSRMQRINTDACGELETDSWAAGAEVDRFGRMPCPATLWSGLASRRERRPPSKLKLRKSASRGRKVQTQLFSSLLLCYVGGTPHGPHVAATHLAQCTRPHAHNSTGLAVLLVVW